MFRTTRVEAEGDREIDLGELSVFICSILLSLGGFIAIIASACRRSRCSKVGGCCGISCIREVVEDEEVNV